MLLAVADASCSLVGRYRPLRSLPSGSMALSKWFAVSTQAPHHRWLDPPPPPDHTLQAIVIAAALSMSSSAFVLQLLSERGETSSKFGSATLGILLFQVGFPLT